MLSLDRQPVDLWPHDDVHAVSRMSSAEVQSRSDFESFQPAEAGSNSNNATQQPPSRSPSTQNDTTAPSRPPQRTPVKSSGDTMKASKAQGTLPAEKAFSIQIGWRLFRLSGASIMSDAPSFFSNYFEEQIRAEENGVGSVKTLFIDRDPETFADICRHLQGYWVVPQDNAHYVKLYADAQFYSLPRLISQLFDSEIYVSIGGTQFRIPRDTFSGPGNSSNFFSLGFAGLFSTRDDAWPGLDTKGLLRPPPVQPQAISNRCPEIFKDLTELARGYPVKIRNAEHRTGLLNDCKYYGFKGLMHKLFVHDISYNADRDTSEIVMRLEDLHKSGVSFVGDASPSDQSPLGGWVNYARPFVDETSYEAVVEIGNQETRIDLRAMRATFFGATKARISSLFQVVADKMNLPSQLPLGLMMSSGGASAAPASPANTPLSEDRVKIRIGHECHILLDGQEFPMSDEMLALSNNTTNPSAFGDDLEDTSSNTSSAGLGSLIPPNYQSGVSAEVAAVAAGRPSPRSGNFNLRPGTASATATTTTTSPHSQISPHQGQNQAPPPSKKRKRRGSLDDFGEWIVKKGQWRMRVQPRGSGTSGGSHNGGGPDGGLYSRRRLSDTFPLDDAGAMEIVLVAVKLDAVSGQRGRNVSRGFVS